MEKIYVFSDYSCQQKATKISCYLRTDGYSKLATDYIKKMPCRYYDKGNLEWEIPFSHIEILEYLCVDEVEIIYEQSEEDIDKMFSDLPTYDSSVIKTKPYGEFQIDSVNRGLIDYNFILGDQQGLGKTKQAIDISIHHKEIMNREDSHCLVICCVASLKSNWEKEIAIHSNENSRIIGRKITKNGKVIDASLEERNEELKSKPKEFFWIVNIEMMRDAKKKENVVLQTIYKLINEGVIGYVIIDEVHKCKNPTSAQSKGLIGLPRLVSKVQLTGTLHVKKPEDVYTPLLIGNMVTMNYWFFQKTFMTFGHFNEVTGYKNLELLQLLVQKSMLRRTKKEELDLPKKIRELEYVDLSKQEWDLYYSLLKSKCLTNFKLKVEEPKYEIEALTRIRQALIHPQIISNKDMESSKFNRIRDILEEAKMNGEKVIIFSRFRKAIELLSETLCDFHIACVTGGMDKNELQYLVDDFNATEGFKCISGVIDVLGTGLTLNTANIVIFLDLPKNQADLEQAEDRAHRIGTENTIYVKLLVAKNTWEEMKYENLMSEEASSKIIVDNADLEIYRELLTYAVEGGK